MGSEKRSIPCSGMEGEDGRSSRRSAAAKKPRTKHLLCEQDPEAPGLTMEQRRKIRRYILALIVLYMGLVALVDSILAYTNIGL